MRIAHMGDCTTTVEQAMLDRAPRSGVNVPGDHMKDFCPNCRTARVGGFRFCFGCRLDFDAFQTGSRGSIAAIPRAEQVVASTVAVDRISARGFPGRGLLAVAIALVVGVSALGSVTEIGPISPASEAATATARLVAVADATPTRTTSPQTGDLMSGPTGETTEARVVRVVDGDTIVVSVSDQQFQVSYIGLDMAETADPTSSVAWMGPQASAANEALVAGKTVVLERDVSDADQHGRLLRYVWLTDGATWTLVNLELVKAGVALVATDTLDLKYVDVYLAAQEMAQATRTGLWGAKPTVAHTPTAKEKPTKPEKPNPKPTAKPKARPVPRCDPSTDRGCRSSAP
jgi:micrococcal nuclease